MKKTNEQICEEVSQIRNIDEVKTYKLCFTDGTSCILACTERYIIMDDDIDCYYDMDDDIDCYYDMDDDIDCYYDMDDEE